MAKDPRFNFYPDNYMGGTMGFTLEQHGAYLQLIIMQSKIGPFTEQQALDHLASMTRGNTAVYTGLWNFLIPKFTRKGELYFSERLAKEMEKSRRYSQKQAERIKKRWSDTTVSTTVTPEKQVLPVMEVELEMEGKKEKGVQSVKPEIDLDNVYDDITRESLLMAFRDIDVDAEWETFKAKVRGSPDHYRHRAISSLRLAFNHQLRNAKKKGHGNTGNKQNQGGTPAASATIRPGKDFGNLRGRRTD